MKTPDNTTKAPPLDKRIETGPLQFGDDWPGIFIRGDEALFLSSYLDQVRKVVPSHELYLCQILKGFAETLRSCSVGDTGWPPHA